MRARLLVGTLAMVVGFGSAIALAQAGGESEAPALPSGPFETRTECEEANATLAKLTGHGYDYFVPKCPSAQRLQAVAHESRPHADFVAACEDTIVERPGDVACRNVVEAAREYEDAFGVEPE